MYCPQCGQQQVSGELRFCSRCGFQLNGVTQLLEAGGELPGLNKVEQRRRRSPRYEGVRQGVILMFAAMVLVPLANLIGDGGEVLPVTLIMLGLMRLLYAVIFQEGEASRKKREAQPSYVPPPMPQQMNAGGARGGGGGGALPPAQSVPVGSYAARRVETAEIVQPPSVTEHTTKLLNNRDDYDEPASS
ncbi:MAG TPA: hypothetical protein VF708_12690 [Pyrinomonadaceae bacterium]|jgi:hypothetical protein